jgi:hypothetical protein
MVARLKRFLGTERLSILGRVLADLRQWTEGEAPEIAARSEAR